MSTTDRPLCPVNPQVLPDDVRLLKDMICELLESLRKRTSELEGVRQRLDQLLRRLYGPRAERWDPNQPLLFPEILQALSEPVAVAPPAATQDDSGNGKAAKHSGHGRQVLPQHLPKRRDVLDVSEAEKLCPCCGGQRCQIGTEVNSRLDYEPSSLFIAETVRPKYACSKCETGVAMAPLPPQTIDKGMPGPGLLAHVIVSKFADHLPLNRQEHILARHGVHLARSTLCDWMAQAGEVLRPLYECMHLSVVESTVVHGDATPVQVQDEQVKGKTRKAFFWNFIGDSLHPYRMFKYTPTQNQDGPKDFLRNFAGWLQADAATVYDPLYRELTSILEAGCWAHARRGFFDAKDSHPQPAHEALSRIRRLYKIEREAKGLNLKGRLAILHEPGDAEQEQRLADIADFAERVQVLQEQVQRLQQAQTAWEHARQDAARPLEERMACWDEKERLLLETDYVSFVLVRLKLRRFFAVPKLEAFHAWLEEQSRTADLPKSVLGKALGYALGNWQALNRYTQDGALDIDNNLAEQTIRQVAIGRKNWLFLGSDQGGKTAEVHLTLMATCKGLGIEPFAYLRDILKRLPTHPPDRLAELLPDRWAHAQRRRLIEEELAKLAPTVAAPTN